MELTRRELLGAAGAVALAAGIGPGDEPMITIPAITVELGTSPELAARLAAEHGCHVSWLAGESPRRVALPAFRIDRYPVTVAEYAEYLRATGKPYPPHWRGTVPSGLERHPITGVSQPDALAYAAWAGKRLPTEDEWEAAARGPEALLYPWGNTFDPDACCWRRSGNRGAPTTDPVDAHPRGASPFGVADMAGNVAEWCATKLGPATAVIKGGCWNTFTPLSLRPACRIMSGWATNQANFYGFRCAAEA